MNLSPLFFAVMLLTACNNKSKQSTEAEATSDSSKSEVRIQVPDVFCYSHIAGKDTIYLRIEKFPNVVTGNLSYKFQEKDSNKGTIDGVLKGDTLIADYTFMSESKSSVRQVIFLMKDSVATEGYGPMEERNGKMIFKNSSTVDFSKGIRLKKYPCPVN